jgi:hypothetical protein
MDVRTTNMSFKGLDLRTVIFLLLALFIVFGIIKKLFKLVIFVALAIIAYYVFTTLF